MEPIKVLLIDDHEIFRNGLKELISKERDITVVGEAANGEEALQLTQELTPDVLIMDIRMPGMNGIETAERILQTFNDPKIIMFSLYDNEEYIVQALSLGAKGYLLKDTSNKIFLSAIRAVHKGEYYYIGEVSDKVIRYFKNNPATVRVGINSTERISLSKREEEIIKLIRRGLNSKEIAEALSVSVRTIDAHRFNILRKFSVNSMDEVLSIMEKEY